MEKKIPKLDFAKFKVQLLERFVLSRIELIRKGLIPPS